MRPHPATRMVAGAPPPDPHLAAFVGLIFRHFRPRRGRIPRFGDDALRRLTMPVLLVVGGGDGLLDSSESQRRLEHSARRLTVRYLPEAGHLLPGQTQPILDFLRSSVNGHAEHQAGV